MEAKKIIKTVTEEADIGKEGKYEIQKTHVLDVDIDEDLITDVCEYWDDSEEAYEVGIVRDKDDDLVYIEVDNLVEAIKERISENEDEDEDPDEQFVELLEKLQKYKGYTIWM